jgi:hypothetical protein
MFRTVFPYIIRSSRLHIQQQVYVKQILLPAASGDELKHVECFTRINNLRNKCVLLILPQEYITMHGPMNVNKIGLWGYNLVCVCIVCACMCARARVPFCLRLYLQFQIKQSMLIFKSFWPPSQHTFTVVPISYINLQSRSQWPRRLRRKSAAVRLLRSWVPIPPCAWMFVCFECCVMPGRGLCDGLITRPKESDRLRHVVVCDVGTSWMRRPWPTGGCRAKNKQTNIK